MPQVHSRRVTIGEIVDTRKRVFNTLPEGILHFAGDESSRTWHFGAFLSPISCVPVCCMSCMFVPFMQRVGWQVRGMATEPHWQGRGVGAQLLTWAMRELVTKEYVRFFWCNAQVPAIGFYEKQGWEVVSEDFDISPAGLHRKMKYIYRAV